MTTYVALLRAVNVGGTNRITMADLRRAFAAAGLADATTHIQTGNVIFTSAEATPAVKVAVESLIASALGLTITAIMRTAEELDGVVRSNPFLAAGQTCDVARLATVFLDGTPSGPAVETFLAAPIAPDQVILHGREVFVHYARGAGSSKLTPSVWNRLGVASTARNWKVTTTLASLAADHDRR